MAHLDRKEYIFQNLKISILIHRQEPGHTSLANAPRAVLKDLAKALTPQRLKIVGCTFTDSLPQYHTVSPQKILDC